MAGNCHILALACWLSTTLSLYLQLRDKTIFRREFPDHCLNTISSCEQTPSDLSDHEQTRMPTHRSRESRFFRHVVISVTTQTFLKRVKFAKRGALATAAVLAAATMLSCAIAPSTAGVVASGNVARSILGKALARRGCLGVASAFGSLCALGLGAVAGEVEDHFYSNFERHPVLD